MRPVLALGGLALSAYLAACMAPGQVSFGAQHNLIVWDEATKTEHFIRVASFEGQRSEVGFLAPTPSLPVLTAVDGEVFRDLQDLQPVLPLRPRVRTQLSKGITPAGVAILQLVEVGGYEAVSFRADDGKALAEYLNKHGFQVSELQRTWLDTYVAKKWIITAFQVKLKNQKGSTSPVRMTFKTDRPFNPYYVPSDNAPRSTYSGLRVYFISNSAYAGELEDGTPWHRADQESQIPLREFDRKLIAKRLALPHEKIGLRLTTWADRAFPQECHQDLFFTAVSDKPVQFPENLVRRGERERGTYVKRIDPPTAAVVGIGAVAWFLGLAIVFARPRG